MNRGLKVRVRTAWIEPTAPIVILVAILAIATLTAVPAAAIWPTDSFNAVPATFRSGMKDNVEAVADGMGGAIVVWDGVEDHPDLFDVDFVTVDVGIAVGASGTILTTNDGGATWVSRNSGTASTLRSVDVSSVSVATAVGDLGTILRTVDGGATWTAQSSGTTETLRCVSFLDPNQGFAVGDLGVMRRTTNGGSTWVPGVVTSTDLYGVVWISSQEVWAVGAGGLLMHSVNAGGTWTYPSSGTAFDLYAIDFFTTTYGVAVGQSRFVAYTTDGGLNWTWGSVPGGFGENLYAVDVLSATEAVAAGQTLFQTNNLAFWNELYSPAQTIYGVGFTSATTGTVVGANGDIVRTTDLVGSQWVYQSEYTNIYAQRVSRDGDLLWGPDGVTVCSATGLQVEPHLTADQSGGAVVVWYDNRYGTSDRRLFSQRLDENGISLWAGDGVMVYDTTTAVFFNDPIVTDESGGAIFTFQINNDIRAQRVYSDGSTWGPRGVSVVTDPAAQWDQMIAPDGQGGAVIVWEDYRNGNADVFAEHVDGNGVGLWGQDFVIAFTADSEVDPQVVPSPGDGVIVAYGKSVSGGNSSVVAKYLSFAHQQPWGSGGVVMRDLPSGVLVRGMVPDGSQGAIVLWYENRNSMPSLYAGRVTGSGQQPWATDGNLVVSTGTPTGKTRVVQDNAGGLLMVWEDYRSGGCCSTIDLFGQHVDRNGTALWPLDGAPVATAYTYQDHAGVASDGSGGAIVAWSDGRNGVRADVFCQRIERNGYLGDPAPVITSVVDAPGDQGGVVVVGWDASYLDAYPEQVVTHYSVWRRIGSGVPVAGATSVAASAAAGAVGVPRVAWTGGNKMSDARTVPDALSAEKEDARARALAAGLSEELVAQRAAANWVYVDNVTAFYMAGYGYDAPTYGDSSAAGTPMTEFQVLAHGQDQWTFWTSNPASGYSVDNLSPSPPLMLAGDRVASDVDLRWQPGTSHYEDLQHYAIYRSTDPGFTPGPGNFIGTAVDTAYVDTGVGTGKQYYRVTAVDVHDNEGTPSNELEIPGAPTGTRTPALPSVLTLLPNHPNPFSAATTFRFGLPAAAEVSIDVYDVAGRRVFSGRVTEGAGWHEYRFSGGPGATQSGRYAGDRLPSGVYFYRVTAGGETQTRKMVITR